VRYFRDRKIFKIFLFQVISGDRKTLMGAFSDAKYFQFRHITAESFLQL